MSARPVLRRALPVLLIVAAALAFVASVFGDLATFDLLLDRRAALREFVQHQTVLALTIYILGYTFIVAFGIPGGTLLTLTGGFLFGVGVGAPSAACAATIGAAVLFLAARTILNDFRRGLPGGAVDRIREGFRRSAWSYMLSLRLTPLVPFWLVNLAAAAAGIPLRTFIWTTAVGILPATFIFAAAGADLDHLASASAARREACQAADATAECHASVPWNAILSPAVLATLVGLSLLALLPAAIRAWQAARPARVT